jgi:hypothetical protein
MNQYWVEAPFGLTLPFRFALWFVMPVAEPVDTVGDEAATATPTAIPNAASDASTKLIVRFIDTPPPGCCSAPYNGGSTRKLRPTKR